MRMSSRIRSIVLIAKSDPKAMLVIVASCPEMVRVEIWIQGRVARHRAETNEIRVLPPSTALATSGRLALIEAPNTVGRRQVPTNLMRRARGSNPIPPSLVALTPLNARGSTAGREKQASELLRITMRIERAMGPPSSAVS